MNRKNLLKKSISLFLSLILLSISAKAAKFAVILAVRSGDQTLSDTNKSYCRALRELLQENGFDKKQISLFFEGGNSEIPGAADCSFENIRTKMLQLESKLKKQDSLWFFIFGHANFTTRGLTLASKGKRIKGNQLADWLDKIKAQQYIFAFNRQSAPLMKLLCNRSDRAVFTAASDIGHLNPPIIPEYMIDEWKKRTKTPIVELFNTAAKKTENFYTSRGLAIAEVPQLFDGKKITVYPFEKLLKDKKTLSPMLSASLAGPAPSPLIATVTENKKQPDSYNRIDSDSPPPDFSEFDQFHNDKDNQQLMLSLIPPLISPTEESLRAITDAKKQSLSYSNFNAFCTKNNIIFTVNSDGSTKTLSTNAFYLIKEAAAEDYARIYFQDSSSHSNITVTKAEIIYPDGSYRNIEDKITPNPERHTRYHLLKFPAAAAGCLIRYTIEVSELPQTQLHNYNQNFVLQKRVPSDNVKLVIRTPKKQFFNYKLYHSDKKPSETYGEYSKITMFDLGALPAMETLPFDPPFRDCVIRIAVSSMKNWQSFREWTERIMTGSEKIDKRTAKFAEKIANFAKTDSEKVKALYEYICELRYETTPIGAGAFRPRLPAKVCLERYGDCKDKANALVALAGALGIKGNIALVNRMSSTDKDFPSWQFNHAVAFFPKLDGYPNGIWCDATDGSTPFASLPPGDIGRDAFILLKDSFEFRKITTPSNSINLFSETVDIAIDKNNSATAILHLKASGLSDYYLRQTLKKATPLGKIYIIQKIIDKSFTGLSVKSVKTSPLEKLSQPIEIEASCFSENADLMIAAAIKPPVNLWQYVAATERNRPLLINDGQQLTIEQQINIKGKTPISFISNQKNIYCDTEVKFSNNNNNYSRYIKCSIKIPEIPPADYKTFRDHIINWYRNFMTK